MLRMVTTLPTTFQRVLKNKDRIKTPLGQKQISIERDDKNVNLLLTGVPLVCAAQESNQEPKQAFHGKLRCYRYTNGAINR